MQIFHLLSFKKVFYLTYGSKIPQMATSLKRRARTKYDESCLVTGVFEYFESSRNTPWTFRPISEMGCSYSNVVIAISHYD